MILTKGLIAKAALALAGVASATTVGIVYKDQISSAFGSTQNAEVVNKTKWDDGLINFFESGDIQFKVTKDNGSGEVDTNSLTFSNQNTYFEVKIKATNESSNDTGTLTETDSGSTKKTELQNLNRPSNQTDGSGTAWTWECKIIFNKEGGASGTDLDETLKTKFKDFLTKIKGNNNKEIKKKFIEKCAESRTSEINKKLKALDSLTSITSETISKQEANKIKAEKTFNMVNSDGSTLKIKAEDEQTFKDFFSIAN